MTARVAGEARRSGGAGSQVAIGVLGSLLAVRGGGRTVTSGVATGGGRQARVWWVHQAPQVC